MKQKANKSEMCFDFQTKYNSMKTIINSLENISAKCELFFRQFNVHIDNPSHLDQYKKLLTAFKSELGSEYLRQTNDTKMEHIVKRMTVLSDSESDSVLTNNKQKNNVRKIPVISDSESDVAPNDSDKQSIEDFDLSNDVNTTECEDRSEFNVFDSNITQFSKRDKKGNKIKYYVCPANDCGFKSNNRSNVVSHMDKHTNERDIQCYWPGCEKGFSYRNSLISHIESYHLRKERFKCCVDGCGQTFLFKRQLQTHMSDKHLNTYEHNCIWFECQLTAKTCICLWPNCGQQFLNKELLDSHMEFNHLCRRINFESNEDLIEASKIPQNWLKCDQNGCGFQTLSELDINEHKLKHKSRYIPLNRRNQNTESDELREMDVNIYTGKPLSRKRRPKNYKCSWPACEATFESQHAVQIHMRKHTGEKPFKCDWPECGRCFRFKGALKLHKESIHLKLKQFKCDQCDEAFLLQTALVVHKSKHTGIKRLQCDWPGCEWRTNFGQQLEIHRKRTHEGKKVYLKKYKSKTKSDPTSIYDSKGNLKPFPCDWPGCERRFRIEANLQPHIRWHQKTANEPNPPKKKYIYPKKPREPKPPKVKKEKVKKGDSRGRHAINEKKYLCEWPNCNSAYTTKSMLHQHNNTHTGQKPYHCYSCGQSFAYHSSLSSHISTNHSESSENRPYKCNVGDCNRSFDKTRALMAHQRIAHNIRNTTNITINSKSPPNEYCESISTSTSYSSRPPSQDMSVPEQYVYQNNIIRLDRIKAFNSSQIQPQNQIYQNFTSSAYQRERQVPTPTPFTTTHTTAKKLLTNALKRPKTPKPVQHYTQPVDNESIARELPHPCTHSGCWRRFRTVKALDWHLKKFH